MKLTITIPIPKITAIRGFWKWGLLVLVALASVFVWGGDSPERAEAGGVPGQLNITKYDNGDPPQLLANACFLVMNGITGNPFFNVCDNDFQGGPDSHPYCEADGTIACEDKDPSKGRIRVTLFAIKVLVRESKPPPGYNPDERKQQCWVDPEWKCELVFVNTFKPSQINVNKVSLAVKLPKSCYQVDEVVGPIQNPLFNVCDNDFQGPPDQDAVCIPDGLCEDEDLAVGSIRVTVVPGVYSVLESKPPPNHTADPSKQPCNAVAGSKCDLTFVNTQLTLPWHPWDVDGNGVVRMADITEVVRHYGQDKP